MSTDSEPRQPSFRFRDKFSRFKDRVKEKVRDKAIRHNITHFVHHNLTSNDTPTQDQSSRHGFRQHMHHYKDVFKNKTHYASIKDKIKDKIDDKFDLHHNKTYPKGFYDSLFSPDTENDVYLQTALICLWFIAVLCIIPTIIVIFLPARKSKNKTTSTNMIFFHVFFCELCYLSYVLLAMINVWKDFRLGETWCDIANYGMYVTIPIMQFALLFLSLERLSKHFTISMSWVKIFTKPYLIQVILCAIWIFLIALLLTFMFIKKQFSFSFVKDQIENLAPPLIGDVLDKLASRRHHCSVDGRLSSVFKTVIIILFIVLIVKPILLSFGLNLLSPFCCRGHRKDKEKYDDRRTTRLVTIFLLLNFFFSFPFYFTSMFKSIFTKFDSTKDTFSIVLKICFILRITNIIFECLAFYIFERNCWNLLSKLLYYCTCKKFQIFNTKSHGDAYYSKDPKVKKYIKKAREETPKKPKKEAQSKPAIADDKVEEDDDDGAFVKKPKKEKKIKKQKTPEESEDERPFIKPPKKQLADSGEEEETEPKKSKSPKKTVEEAPSEESDIPEEKSAKSEEETEEEKETTKRKSRTKGPEDEETTTKRKSRTTEPEEEERPKSKSRVPNGTTTTQKHSEKPIRRRTPSPRQSDADDSPSPSPVRKPPSKPRPSSSERIRHHTKSPTSSSRPQTRSAKKSGQGRSKKKRKDHQTRILEMSDDV